VAALQAALELGRRVQAGAPADRRLIRSPSDAADLLLAEMSTLVQEELWVLVLDTRSRVITVEKVYRGNVSSSIVRPAEVFREAVRRTAPSILIAHNHPSHDPSPSPNDLDVTRDLIAAGRLLGITLRDHLIIGGGSRYVSLKVRGIAFDDDED
jgi:DNA repair protein RadC